MYSSYRQFFNKTSKHLNSIRNEGTNSIHNIRSWIIYFVYKMCARVLGKLTTTQPLSPSKKRNERDMQSGEFKADGNEKEEKKTKGWVCVMFSVRCIIWSIWIEWIRMYMVFGCVCTSTWWYNGMAREAITRKGMPRRWLREGLLGGGGGVGGCLVGGCLRVSDDGEIYSPSLSTVCYANRCLHLNLFAFAFAPFATDLSVGSCRECSSDYTFMQANTYIYRSVHVHIYNFADTHTGAHLNEKAIVYKTRPLIDIVRCRWRAIPSNRYPRFVIRAGSEY